VAPREPKHDLHGIIARINRLAAKVREESGTGIFVQHCGCEGDDFEPQTPGWAFLPELVRDPADVVVRKRLNDPFAATELQARLKEIAPDRLLITGWATDLCVDTTVRSAVENHHNVVVVTDGHTLSDRRHLDAISVIRHPQDLEQPDHATIDHTHQDGRTASLAHQSLFGHPDMV
jgi:nicotinamidase-related amidase